MMAGIAENPLINNKMMITGQRRRLKTVKIEDVLGRNDANTG